MSMSRWCQWPWAAAVLISLFVMRGEPASAASSKVAPPIVRARAALVMDAQTGALLWSKHPDERLPPASTTKVMTVVLALESGRQQETFVVSANAASTPAVKLYLRTGDRVQLDDLTRALLLKSANDASVVVAEGLAGSVKRFSAQMNRRAFQVGARNTRFVNPNGLPAKGHYSTARDLALIMRHALSVPGFRQVASTYRSTVTTWHQKKRRTIQLRNSNRLLRGYRVPVIGKTGYTRAAKRCFVGAASLGGREIIVALLGSTDLWGDAQRLIDFGLDTIAAGESPSAPVARPVATQAKAAPTPPSKRTVSTSRPAPRRVPILVSGSAPTPAHMAEPASPPLAVPAPVAEESRAPQLVAHTPGTLPDPAAATRAAPEPAAAPDDRTGYSLVLMPADNSRAAAERLRHFVGRRGHRAIVETTGTDDSRLYRVRVVGLPTREAALRAGDRLRAEHLQPAIVPPG